MPLFPLLEVGVKAAPGSQVTGGDKKGLSAPSGLRVVLRAQRLGRALQSLSVSLFIPPDDKVLKCADMESGKNLGKHEPRPMGESVLVPLCG